MEKTGILSKGYFWGLIVGFGAGISIGLTFTNILIGFAVTAVSGVSFAMAFENTSKTGDENLANAQRKILFLLVGLTALLLITVLTYNLYLK